MSDKHKALRSALARDDYTQGKLWFASFAVDVAMLLECHDRLTADYAAATHLLADRDAHIERLKAELATLRASAASVQADQRAEIDAARALRKGTP